MGELPKSWDIPIEGYEVLQVTFAFPIDLVLYEPDGGRTATIRLSGPYALTGSDGKSVELDVAGRPWEENAVLLSFRRDKVRAARAWEPSQLRVEFESGRTIAAGPGHYENWEVTTPGMRLIARAFVAEGNDGIAWWDFSDDARS